MKNATLAVLLVLGTMAAADSITIDGKTQDGVYITESSSLYLVSDPATGKVSTYPKDGAQVTLSDTDARQALLEQWQAVKSGEKDAGEKSDEIQTPESTNAPPKLVIKGTQDAATIAHRQAMREQILANQAAAQERGAAANEAKAEYTGITSADVHQRAMEQKAAIAAEIKARQPKITISKGSFQSSQPSYTPPVKVRIVD